MAELVDDGLVERLARRHDEAPVEGERAARRAGAPARALVANRDRRVGDADPVGLALDNPRRLLTGALAVPPIEANAWERSRDAAEPDSVVALQPEPEGPRR